MNTLNSTNPPYLKATRSRDYEFILEDLELAFTKEQLKSITDDWNNGNDIEALSNKYKRRSEEVFLALFHQARKRKIKRPFAYRRG